MELHVNLDSPADIERGHRLLGSLLQGRAPATTGNPDMWVIRYLAQQRPEQARHRELHFEAVRVGASWGPAKYRLIDAGLIEKVSHGLYRLTDAGRQLAQSDNGR